MAVVLLDAMYFVGAVDLTGQSNRIEFEDSIEEKETTNWASQGRKEYIGGLESVAINAAGQWEAGGSTLVDDAMWASRRVVESHLTFPNGSDVGDVAYFTRALRTNAKLDWSIGEVAPWALTAMGSDPAVRGPILHPPGTAVTGDGDGSAVQHIAVPAGKRLWGLAVVPEYSGLDSLVVTVESDTVATFDGSAETRLTFDTFTDVGWNVQRTTVGAHADTWYRVSFDATGTGSADVIVAIGIA